MEYIKIDQDNNFELCKKAVLYRYVVTQGLIYNRSTNQCLGHNAEFYYKQDGAAPDLSAYEIRFNNGKIQRIS